MKWFVVRYEGGLIEYVSLERLRQLWNVVPILGAELGQRRVFFDRILRRHGRPPFRRQDVRTGISEAVAG